MTEWAVVGVIVALIGLVTSIVTPLIKLNTTITKLDVTVGKIERNLDDLTRGNAENHARIWLHEDEQDKALADHETRIRLIERH